MSVSDDPREQAAQQVDTASRTEGDLSIEEDGQGAAISNSLPDLKASADRIQAGGRFQEAEERWQDALALKPDDGEAICGVAYCFLCLDRPAEADPYLARVLRSAVLYYAPWIRLGAKLMELHRPGDAADVFRALAAGYPGQGEVWNHLGLAELGVQRPAAALACFRKAGVLQPTVAAVWCNMVLALLALDRLPEALAVSHRALAIEPASPVATFNMSFVLLAMGRLREGFAAYEHRFALPNSSWLRHEVGALPWTGEPLAGRSILVVGEQAFGDHIQFARYVPDLVKRGARVTYMMPGRLLRLMGGLGEGITLIDTLEAGSRFDYQVPLLSLAHHCTAADDRVPAAIPYLAAEPERVAAWRERVGSGGFRVGIAWQGNRYPGNRDFNRSFPVEALRPVAALPGVRLVSLQVRDGLEQLPHLLPGLAVETLGDDFDSGDHAFLDAAAVMMNVDLVITLDSALAHLAGALGRPTWLALPFAPEWRWQRGRDDTPWYPTMRLFTQGVLGDWDGVFQRMAELLASLMRHGGASPEAGTAALPLAPTSCGEVLDKIAILEIKVERLPPPAAAQAGFELRHLQRALAVFGALDAGVGAAFAELRRINRLLWDVEDRLRGHEAEQRFDADFVALARSVYALNDERAATKRRINAALNSAIVEQKSYGGAAPEPSPAG